MQFGDLLRRYRSGAGLTQEALAERAGMSLRGLSDLERGARRAPHRDTVWRLAEALALGEMERAALFAAARPARVSRPISPLSGPVRRLPLPLSSFVGRDRELSAIRRRLASSRLLTLTGPGGIGKTRLALHVCADLINAYPGGVLFVELGPLSDPRLVLQQVATVLGIPEERGSPLLDTLVAALNTQPPLLVLDNCEHLLESVAELVAALLQRVREPHVLATSREALRTEGEVVWQVPTLSVASSGSAAATWVDQPPEAVRLFVERAQTLRAGFELDQRNTRAIASICRRLDGIPLAIELAAAWVASLSPEDLLARLEASPRFLVSDSHSTPPRHQTMEAAIRWSYDLLSEAERQVFRSLSVFAGGFSLDAAEAVCGSTGDTAWGLRRLVGKSLVMADPGAPGGTRYRLLEPLRDFGAALLRQDPCAPALQDRHAAFYVSLVRQSSQVMSGGPAMAWNERLLREYQNLHVALRWFLETGDAESAQLAGAALAQIWRRRGHLSEGRSLVAELMALPSGAEPTAARASLLIAAGQAAQAQADFDGARALFVECVPIARRLGDPLALALAFGHLSDAARAAGDLEAAHERVEEGLSEVRGYGAPVPIALLTQRVALAAYAAGDLQEACLVMEEALPSLRSQGWTRRVAEGLQVLAAGALARRDERAAREFLEEALDLAYDVNDLWGAAKVRVELARVEVVASHPEAARDRLTDCLSLCRDIGDRWGLALALEVGAALAASLDELEHAIQLAAAAENQRDAIGAPASPRERMWSSARLERARQGLGEAAYARVYERGRHMPLEAAVELALQLSSARLPRDAQATGQPADTDKVGQRLRADLVPIPSDEPVGRG